MNIPPLAVVQARLRSTRLERKMLLPLGGRPLVWWAWKAACDAVGVRNVVVASPASRENDELADAVWGFGGEVFRYAGPESDVLGRFHACAHRYRWHPNTVILRVTPDDPFKRPGVMRKVVAGERHPVELGGEAFTLAMLDLAHAHSSEREHLTLALFPTLPPTPPPGVWTIDTPADYIAAQRRIDGREKEDREEGTGREGTGTYEDGGRSLALSPTGAAHAAGIRGRW